jgi:hypothetical protein
MDDDQLPDLFDMLYSPERPKPKRDNTQRQLKNAVKRAKRHKINIELLKNKIVKEMETLSVEIELIDKLKRELFDF